MKKLLVYITLLSIFSLVTLFAQFNFDTTPKILSAYYIAKIQPLNQLIQKLEENGFEVLAETEILKDKIIITISNPELKATNSYLATLHLLVNNIHPEIRVQNPSYFAAAYLQEKYKYGQFQKTLNALEEVLGEMYESKDIYEFSKLAHFQFLLGMPYLQDTREIREITDPLDKLHGGKSKKYIAYTLKLPNGSILVGHKLRRRIHKFLTKINQCENAQVLPYESIIQNGKVSILNPKYYLTLSLPLLDLDGFMKIASSPDAIERAIKRAYR